MKKANYVLTIVLGLFISLNSYAQYKEEETNAPKNVINVNLTSLLIRHYGISYERVLSERNSIRLYGEVAYYNYTRDGNNINLRGFAIVPEFRHYLGKRGAPSSYFIGIYAPFRRYETEGDFEDNDKTFTGSGTFSYLGIGFVTGPQWTFGKRISLAIPFGLSGGAGTVKGNYTYVDKVDPSKSESKKADIPLLGGGFMPRFGIELGIAF